MNKTNLKPDRLVDILYTKGVDAKTEFNVSTGATDVTCITRHSICNELDAADVVKRYEAYSKALDNTIYINGVDLACGTDYMIKDVIADSTGEIISRKVQTKMFSECFKPILEGSETPSTRPDSKKEMVNHPSHYQSDSGLEVIDVIREFTKRLDGIEAFDTGNVIKYACRWKDKGGVEDLRKVAWYANHLADHLDNNK